MSLRVCSVLPSATEILCAIGGAHLLVGRSHEDNFPQSITHLPILTGQKTTFTTAGDVDKQVSAALSSGQSLYTLDVDLLASLQPDVILTQDICSVCAIDLQTVERVAAQMSPRPRVVSLNPMCLEDVLSNVLEVGEAVGMQQQAQATHAELLARIARVDAAVTSAALVSPPKVAFIEWPDPIYVGGHWTPQLIARGGGAHPLNPAPAAGGGGGGKSFPVEAEAVVTMAPDLVIVCPCGLDLGATRREAATMQRLGWWQELAAVREGAVHLVDGDAHFNRPGPRLVDALEWLAATLLDRPDLAPPGFPAERLAADTEPTSAGTPASCGAHALVDIEEAHAQAYADGALTYVDPQTGYTVFTQRASEERGHCCGSGCRHCAYNHERVPPKRKAAGLAPPIVVRQACSG